MTEKSILTSAMLKALGDEPGVREAIYNPLKDYDRVFNKNVPTGEISDNSQIIAALAARINKASFLPLERDIEAKVMVIYSDQAIGFIEDTLSKTKREAGTQWQPIETAPKDRYGAAGLILVCWENSEMYPVISRWLKNAKAWSMPFNKPVTPPTHWMELPKPFTKIEGQEP